MLMLWFLVTFFTAELQAQTGLNDHLNDQWIAFERAGAPNSNLQCFSPKNVTVSDGYLLIATRLQSDTCASFDLRPASYHYTSGFVAMRSFNFLYGTVRVRARFGGGAGTGAWPVIWMADASCQTSDPSGTDDNCNEQEIDVAEILGGNFRQVNQQIHVDRFKHEDGCKVPVSDVSREFHVYELDWGPRSLVFKIDGATTCNIVEPYVPNTPMYLKIDTFVGGYGGAVNNASLPWTTRIDYVKITQGSALIFNDGFSPEPADQPVPVITPIWKLENRKLSVAMLTAIVFLAVSAVALAYRLRFGPRK